MLILFASRTTKALKLFSRLKIFSDKSERSSWHSLPSCPLQGLSAAALSAAACRIIAPAGVNFPSEEEVKEGRGDIGRAVASFSMHVRAVGRSLSQMPVYRLQGGGGLGGGVAKDHIIVHRDTGDTGQQTWQRGRGPNDPCQDEPL